MSNHHPRSASAEIFFVCVAIMALTSLLPSAAAPIWIESGLVEGVVLDEDSGMRVYRGIPFAAPPFGDLRWKPPQPVEPWQGVRVCDAFSPACPQAKSPFYDSTLGMAMPETSEDCLYLNVWTASQSPDDKLPVMVWIHGGGNRVGWSYQPRFDGEAFARNGVVLVTLNYRLGPFGFFAHPELSRESVRGVSGNYGLLDQLAALEWVRDNIKAFGGDPANVTLFGESAGGFNTVYHCVSPLTKGLFHRAVIQSGSSIWSTDHLRDTSLGASGEALGRKVAKEIVGTDRVDDLVALRSVSAGELVEKTTTYRFRPVVDGWFVPDYPAVLYDKGLQHNIPLIAGTNGDEGTIFSQRSPYEDREGWRTAVALEWGDDAADPILALYPNSNEDELRAAITKYTGDTMFIASTRATVRSMAKVSSRAYLYHFTRAQSEGPFASLGAFHASELHYVFNSLNKVPIAGVLSPVDTHLAEVMNAYWVQFAKTGDPNGHNLPKWPAYDTASDKHIEFGDTIQVRSGLHSDACDLFERLTARKLKIAN